MVVYQAIVGYNFNGVEAEHVVFRKNDCCFGSDVPFCYISREEALEGLTEYKKWLLDSGNWKDGYKCFLITLNIEEVDGDTPSAP